MILFTSYDFVTVLLGGGGADDTRAPVSVEPHCKAVEKAYEELLRQYPTLAPKIDETVGQALALLRQCVRFDFKAQQRFFF